MLLFIRSFNRNTMSHLKGHFSHFFTKVKHDNKDEAQMMMLSQIDAQDN